LQPWQPAPNSTKTEGKPHAATDRALTAKPSTGLNLEIGRNIYESNGKEIESKSAEKQTNGDGSNGSRENGVKSIEDIVKEKEPAFKINCHSCGIDCTRVHYHRDSAAPSTVASQGASAIAKNKYDICPNCYIEARFPAGIKAEEFTKRENPTYTGIHDRDAPWTDSELLRLLEALELYDENWTMVSEKVGTRTPEECVLKFLSLEIDDKYLDSEPLANGSTGLGVLGSAGKLAPFSQADNPVMSVVGYLGTLSDPSVAAAAAGKSIEELRRHMRDSIEKTGAAAGGKGKEKEDNGDSMEIDIRHETTTTTTTTTSISAAASVPLAMTAARASGLASHEEREMTRLVSSAVNATLQKMELKLKQFNEMEAILQAERRELERGRQQLFLDRLSFKKRVRDVQEGLRMAVATGGEQGVTMAQDVMKEGQFEKMAFHSGPDGVSNGNVQPLSADGVVKSFDI
jgi:SWI/SNF related-matrix-associated actin-dependent regulator of chromatin subfamily C